MTLEPQWPRGCTGQPSIEQVPHFHLCISKALLHGSVIWRRGVEGIGGWARSWPRTVTVPFKTNQDRRHHIPKQRHRVTNWAAYDIALRQRGSLTVWFTEAAIAAWKAEPRDQDVNAPEPIAGHLRKAAEEVSFVLDSLL